jgi:hypothetical protein
MCNRDRPPVVPLLLLLGAALACAPSSEPGGAPPDTGDPPAELLPLGALRAEIARATCDALFRCCAPGDDLAIFFAPVANADPNGRYADVIAQVPPNRELSAADCPAVLEQIHAVSGIGAWLDAATAGLVDYREPEARACIAALDDAGCGAPARAALFDQTCFALAPPDGGEEQRRSFARTAAADEACRPIADGFGGLFYGSCDPHAAFCCVLNDAGRCSFPSAASTGTCQRVSAVGEPCSMLLPVQLCATGLECVPDSAGQGDRCLAPSRAPLTTGAACYDPSRFVVLGECVDGYCDLLGSDRCEAKKLDGLSCAGGVECASGACEGGRCGPPTLCGPG